MQIVKYKQQQGIANKIQGYCFMEWGNKREGHVIKEAIVRVGVSQILSMFYYFFSVGECLNVHVIIIL